MTQDKTLGERLTDANVRFYHAENLQNFRTHCQANALVCREALMSSDPVNYTRLYSDSIDERRGVLGRVFGNMYDFGAVFSRGKGTVPNTYGPITLVFKPSVYSIMQDIVITPKSIVKYSDDWRSHAIKEKPQIDALLAGDSFGSPIANGYQFAELSCQNNALPFSFLEKIIVERIDVAGVSLFAVVKSVLAKQGLTIPVEERRYGRNLDMLQEMVGLCESYPASITEDSWALHASQLPPSAQDRSEQGKIQLLLWCHNFFFGTVQSLRIAPSSNLNFEPTVEELIDPLVQSLGPILMNSDDYVTSKMAETNATGFGLDWFEITSAELEDNEKQITFEAKLYYAGDQDPDQMWCGDTVVVKVFGTAVLHDEKWGLDNYSVEDCDIQGEGEVYDDFDA